MIMITKKISGKEAINLFGSDYEKKGIVKIEQDSVFYLVTTSGVQLLFDEEITNDKIFIVLKNADFTEGRGPMLFDKISNSMDKAVGYILSQKGVFGSKQYCQIRVGININGYVYGYTSFNGYELKMVSKKSVYL